MSQYYNLVNSASGSSGWPSNPYEAYGVYGASPFRYRRSLHRRFVGMNFPRANDLKRSHRTKRDLIYPYDALADDYYPPTESYLPYGGYPITGKDEDDDINLGYLLDALDNAKVYNDGYDKVIGYGNPYESPYDAYDTYAALQNPYELEIDEPEVKPWYDVPAKRQAGLSYFPGNKRNPDFYPSFREPWTHYQAFVPEKRSMDEYSDAYRQVMKLAAALRRQNAYYPGDYGYEVFLILWSLLFL
ncbi:hypothetical protein DPMN_042837 [Dreissena polymorpha]|uniref:Uncharacterized protein n=1 Tax=Dreissena polymorpha TaxID=45954 RepID=A0A9D4D143_DREPO|nr:hypothetical protein DPMN_042837 [Dreissena polymorpha]